MKRPHQNTAAISKVEAAYPGMKVVAGPYGINSTMRQVAKEEAALCLRAKQDQTRADPKTICVTHGPQRLAYILVSAERFERNHQAKFRAVTGIKAGHAVKRQKIRL